MSAPASKPVNPCVTSVFDGNRGAEYSTWAHLTTRAPQQCPNLVTAQASTLRVYTLDEDTGKLFETYVFSNLAGNICYLETLPAAASDHQKQHAAESSSSSSNSQQQQGGSADALLLGFCGHPRLTVVSVVPQTTSAPSPALLSATCLMDLTQPLIDSSYGSVTPLEHDLVAATGGRKSNDGATVAVILGAGVAVAVMDLLRSSGASWMAHEPYLLPLPTLSASILRAKSSSLSSSSQAAAGGGGGGPANKDTNKEGGAANSSNTNVASIATGFGDILGATFLKGYIEPTLVLLHSNPNQHGRTWPGRLGRPHWQPGTRHGLLVTAISVTVAHKRSAILWSVEVPADARSLYPIGKNGCLVLCTNSLLAINNAGRIHDFLAVNGFVKSTCPTKLLDLLKSNPKPFPKLAIQLDGAALTFCSETTVFLSLRGGRLFLLKLPSSSDDNNSNTNNMKNGSSNSNVNRMSLLPLGRTLGAVGNVANLAAWPLATTTRGLYDKFAAGVKTEGEEVEGKKNAIKLSMGLLFAGSRLGDSSLLGYALENIAIPWTTADDEQASLNEDTAGLLPDSTKSMTATTSNSSALDWVPSHVSPELDEILREEEEALYAPTSSDTAQETIQAEPNVVPPSDEEDAGDHAPPPKSSDTVTSPKNQQTESNKRRKLSTVVSSDMVVMRALTALDSIVGLGPLGPSCEGPVANPNRQDNTSGVINPNESKAPGATALILPCGYGSSGGLGIITAPGRDERSILAEEDCLDIQCAFSLRHHDLVFLGMKSESGAGIRILRMNAQKQSSDDKMEETPSDKIDLGEVALEDWCKASDEGYGSANAAFELFANASLLACADFLDGCFAVLMSYSKDPENSSDLFYGGAMLRASAGHLEVVTSFSVPAQEKNGSLVSVTPFTIFKSGGRKGKSLMIFACCWSSGVANLVAIDNSGVVKNIEFAEANNDGVEPMDDDDSDNAMERYYSSKKVLAVDLFRAPANFFEKAKTRATKSGKAPAAKVRSSEVSSSEREGLLAGDQDLYYVSDQSDKDSNTNHAATKMEADRAEGWKDEALFLGICRQSGSLEVFAVSDCIVGKKKKQTPVWSCEGCGHGATSLSAGNTQHRRPRLHEVCVRELRFFFCGPAADSSSQNTPSPCRPLCISMDTNDGDLLVYTANARSGPATDLCFSRVPLKLVSRESQEQTRFRAKLRRKKIVSSKDDDENASFRHNRLHRFQSLSEQYGLFAATCRPVWLVAERGKPEAIAHRTRHAAPAGGKPRPVTGFCADLDGEGAFLTLHERVGRVGSQRLTLYRSISTMFRSEGLLPGGGFCIERIPLGVTVRRIQFIDDDTVSSGGRCLYAVLVSREVEADMSHLNDDGLSDEERERIEQEKEAAKIKRQVEADLGGFDVEQEWVEEIERENCFQIDKELGGAPPVPQSAYALWILDAANRWAVVDSYELGEFEHGMTMKVMSLTDFPEEPGSANTEEISSEDLETKLFITIGVGIVDKNGEDVSTKGRVLVFEMKVADSRVLSTQAVELALVCEKDIFHGPVTSLTCLTSEGKYRLIIGAGADINVEQWGNGKLTQVGFFRATMQVLDIFMFKNFLLLSDAYDSLYFLVWRESDKSLTLLSKDYDPLAVYAAGTMSRGGSLTFICQDDRQNLQFFQYAPGEAAARGGNKLVCRADFHLGAQTSAFNNHVCRSTLWINSATPSSTLSALKQQDTFYGRSDDDQRLGAHFGTSDGGFGSIIPLSEPVYWRLTALQSVMANALESDCALSQKAWRLYRRSYRRGGCRSNDRKKGVIDGDLIMKYPDLPLPDQEDLASSIGSTVDLILDNLLEIKCANSVI